MRRGTCSRCKQLGVWVNTVTRKGAKVGEFCADCFDHVAPEWEPPLPPGRGGAGDRFDNDPEWDNTIRAAEEDR